MITSKDCLAKFGDPVHQTSLVVFDVPANLEIGFIPKRIYCNKLLVTPLEQALSNMVKRGLVDQIKTWDGCFNIRIKRGGASLSLHSWGLAVDINAATNGFGKEPTMSKDLVKCFKDAGFDWGGDWEHKDGMHFQLSKF